METAKSILPIRWTQTLCVLAGLYAILVTAYICSGTGSPTGGRDFHTFWYAGNFIRQGHDPYAAYFTGAQPALPIYYLDGVRRDQYPVAQADLAVIPSNTPVMLLVLTPLAYFSWDVAKWIFMAINLILMLITGWLILYAVPFAGVKLAPIDELLLFLIYFDFSATRIAIENGQTTLLTFVLMLVAIVYAGQSWKVAGLALGVALSKYSLALPVFLFFLYKARLKLLLLAVTVQGLGVIGLAAVTGTSPVVVAMENIQTFFLFVGLPEGGVHLARRFQFLTTNPLLTNIPVLVMTVVVFGSLLRWLRERKFTAISSGEVIDFHVLTVLFIWAMLVGYHASYDTLVLILFVVLVFKGLAYPNIWELSPRERVMLMAFMAAIPLVLILPARLVDRVLFSWYFGAISSTVLSVFMIIMMIFSMFLLRRYLQTASAKKGTLAPAHLDT
ncbi:MAG TPA: glycosyltransferase family 87 protein [Anaerolineales bacterium]|nr:glycosyltransferase family 87 protein [Anaerolineales bacterium]